MHSIIWQETFFPWSTFLLNREVFVQIFVKLLLTSSIMPMRSWVVLWILVEFKNGWNPHLLNTQALSDISKERMSEVEKT